MTAMKRQTTCSLGKERISSNSSARSVRKLPWASENDSGTLRSHAWPAHFQVRWPEVEDSGTPHGNEANSAKAQVDAAQLFRSPVRVSSVGDVSCRNREGVHACTELQGGKSDTLRDIFGWESLETHSEILYF